MSGQPGHRRDNSRNHVPPNPSSLRRGVTASPERTGDSTGDSTEDSSQPSPVRQSSTRDFGTSSPDSYQPAAGPSDPASPQIPNERTFLLRSVLDETHVPHSGPCNHGTFSPRPGSPTGSWKASETETSSLADSEPTVIDNLLGTNIGRPTSWRRRLGRKIRSKKMTTSSALAERHGVEDSTYMYLSYYIPCLIWMRQYQWSWLKGDLIAAITLASMYLPMALSLADNLAHVPAINGLYAFVFNPFIYAILGSCPQMVVGPEAAGSLLIGSIVKGSIDLGKGEDENSVLHAQIAGVAVGIAGATVFIAGVGRLGFLDSVLSRPFLRGFISAIGVVIFIDQLIPELGLAKLAATSHAGHGSPIEKLEFLFSNLGEIHGMTAAISLVSFVIIMVARETKKHYQPRYPSVAYIPDRLVVVVVSAVLAWKLDWESQGVEILGTVKAASGHVFTFRNPFQTGHMKHIREAMGTSFLIGMLGFFESSVAAKSLGGAEVISGMNLSPNRELVALGAANLVGSCFMALPAFGGYGRSKVNKSTGGKSPASSIFLSIFTLIAVLFCLPWFYYLPKPVLSTLITVVAYSLIEEAPHDLAFFLRIRGWTELGLIAIILATTILYSLNMGIAIGIGLSLLQVIRHSTRPRIQILGRNPGTDRFENAEENPERLEFVEGCLIVKIPEPLTFLNTGALKDRLRRLEMYGTSQVHPALPRLRPDSYNKNVIFDIHGVTSMDGSGTQVLEEIVRSYRDRGVRVFFSRPPSRRSKVWALIERSGIVELVGGESHFVDSVLDALKMAEGRDLEEAGACAVAADGPLRQDSPLISA